MSNFSEDSIKLALGARLGDSLQYFLAEISGKIQLSKTQREKAEGHYEAVADILRSSPPGTLLHRLDVKMIPFGGLGTNTPTKPFLGDEFDLDLIVRINASRGLIRSPEILHRLVLDRLGPLDRYEGKLELKDRCLRINYAGEFHLDLMSAVLADDVSSSSTKLWIPERQADETVVFKLVDPVGLMEWFDARCALQRIFKVLNERGDFEAMPLISEDARKSTLRQAVQLVKRMRDSLLRDEKDAKKILKSVVILTVAGECYGGDTDLARVVSDILNELDRRTSDLWSSSISNPVHGDEDFLEPLRHRIDRYLKLRKLIQDMKRDWSQLLAEGLGLERVTALLDKLFGETVTATVFSEYGQRMDEIHRTGRVRMDTSRSAVGALGLTTASLGVPARAHQFFGE